MEREKDGKWKKGQSGNPNGRKPKGQTLTDVLGDKLDPSALADVLIKMAQEGDLGALKTIYDRVDGKAIETINQNVTEMPKVIRFEPVDSNEDTDEDI